MILPTKAGGKEVKYYAQYGQQKSTTLYITCDNGSFWVDHGDLCFGGFTIFDGQLVSARATNGGISVGYDTTTHVASCYFNNFSGTLYGIYTEP